MNHWAPLLSAVLFLPAVAAETNVLRAGMIGLDTSHAPAFTKLLNDPAATNDRAFVQVTHAFPGGSPDIEGNAGKIAKYSAALEDLGVTLVDSIPALLERVDVVLIESVDGRPHLEQALPVFRAGKPVYIDKPLAGNLVDAIAIAELGRKHGVPWFSSSSLRYSPGILAYRMEHPKIGEVTGCEAWSPCALEPHHPDLYWYGVHGCETLFTIMGPGIETVARTRTESTELVVGTWRDGRVGTFRGLRAPTKRGYGAIVYGTKGVERAGSFEGYGHLVERIATFFRTGESPLDEAETIEIMAFMQAADLSKERGGAPVSIAELVAEAKAKAAARLAELER